MKEAWKSIKMKSFKILKAIRIPRIMLKTLLPFMNLYGRENSVLYLNTELVMNFKWGKSII